MSRPKLIASDRLKLDVSFPLTLMEPVNPNDPGFALSARVTVISSGSAGFGEGFGAHRLENRKQYLGVYGFQMLRMGWHTIPGDHLIEVDPMDTGSVGLGEPRVSRPPYTGTQ